MLNQITYHSIFFDKFTVLFYADKNSNNIEKTSRNSIESGFSIIRPTINRYIKVIKCWLQSIHVKLICILDWITNLEGCVWRNIIRISTIQEILFTQTFWQWLICLDKRFMKILFLEMLERKLIRIIGLTHITLFIFVLRLEYANTNS